MNRKPPPKVTCEALLPLYATRFHCIGPECEDTCCSGWRISVDKDAFQAYRQMSDGPLLARMRKRLKLAPPDRKKTATWGEIELEEESRNCAFLEGGSCAIHIELGEEGLCDICYTFPRRYTGVGSQMVHALSLACPEAARLALGSEDALEIVDTPIELREATAAGVRGVLNPEVMLKVHDFCVKLIRSKHLLLWERLAVLGIFCDDLTKRMKAGREATVSSLVDNYEPMLTATVASDALKDMPANHALQAKLFLALIRMGAREEYSPLRSRIQKAVAVGLGVNPKTWEVDEDVLVERYIRGVTRIDEAMKDKPYLMAHYIQNEMMLEGFPFEGKSPMSHYLQLVSRFGLLRTMLAARCTEDPLPSSDELIATVRYFCRRFVHDVSYAAAVNGVLINLGDSTLDRLYSFLRS